ncbi:anaphase promoting complex, subunit 10-like protein [Trypanosoma equiperdum]|uniref:Anaphase-promoting complex subunit 10 n=1 Tax=Trypanosoma equiperdum TaxID=5694 RepID=A0A1G4ILI5_TRYEQ|nr:anaphase promoting complex, subunit 10-like protein [Trypanosoma equiperdum]
MQFDGRSGGEGDAEGVQGAGAAAVNTPSIVSDDELMALEKRESLIVLQDAVWSVSSAKHGNGVMCLLDGSHNTFWQSDGVVPHVISIDFALLKPVAAVALYLDCAEDNSYTPRRMRVQAGTHNGDMADVATVTVDDPRGWVLIRMQAEAETPSSWNTPAAHSDDAKADIENDMPLDNADFEEFIQDGVWCTRVRVIVEENRQEGRDCHVRGLRVLGHIKQSLFTTASFTQNLHLR